MKLVRYNSFFAPLPDEPPPADPAKVQKLGSEYVRVEKEIGVSFEQKPYVRNFDFIRKFSVQRFNPSNGAVGTQDPRWLILQSNPSANHGGGCGGDSGSGISPYAPDPLGDTVTAVHTGGYRMGYLNRLCGRMTSLSHRVDLPFVLDWIEGYLD